MFPIDVQLLVSLFMFRHKVGRLLLCFVCACAVVADLLWCFDYVDVALFFVILMVVCCFLVFLFKRCRIRLKAFVNLLPLMAAFRDFLFFPMTHSR